MKPTMNAKAFLVLSHAFFFLGVVIGLALSVIAIWNNLEATSYYFAGVKHPPFKGLRCPVMIAPSEKGIVTAVFNNPTNEEDNFFYGAEISGRAFSTREIKDQIAVPPRQARNIRFPVDANDVDLLFFILVKITILPNSVHHTQEATCGILVANILGLSGAQASIAAVFLSFAGIAVGLGLWQETSLKADRDRGRVVQTLGFVVVLTLLAAAMGWSAIAIALIVITILLMVISVRVAFT
jgi:hypothetical protein